MAYFKIKGVIPPIITPFKENGDVDYDKFVSNIDKWNSTELAGYLVLGSNSEAVFLTEQEKLKLIRLTVKNANKDKLILVGTGLESTRATIELTNKAAKSGAHAALIITPCFYDSRMNDEVLIKHFTEIANHSAIPILIYNVPVFTHVNVSAKLVAQLSKHPNIIGMKDSAGSIQQLMTFKDIIGADFNLILGAAPLWYPALSIGIQAAIIAIANIIPDECTRIQQAFEQGNNDVAGELYFKTLPVNEAVSTLYSIPGLKCAADLLGFDGGLPRSPLLPLNKEERSNLEKILQKVGLIKNNGYVLGTI